MTSETALRQLLDEIVSLAAFPLIPFRIAGRDLDIGNVTTRGRLV
jgi:hypothetical protein